MDVVTIDRRSGLGDWEAALRERRGALRALLRAYDRVIGRAVGRVGGVVLGGLKGALGLGWRTMGALYQQEVECIAGVAGVGVGDVLVANLAYDLAQVGCTAVVVPGGRGPLHGRNLDWPFPGGLLRRHLTVAHVLNTPAGDYSVLGWPGQFGVLTGVARGRFSISVNYVVHSDESGFTRVVKHALQGYLPVSWLVRDVFETAVDFEGAVDQLSRTKIIAPVLFTVAGTGRSEAVVIERMPKGARLRRPDDGPVCATNHYLAPGLRARTVDVTDGDTYDRYEAAEAGAGSIGEPGQLLRLLARPALLRGDTQYQCAMEPRTGRLWARVPGERLKGFSA